MPWKGEKDPYKIWLSEIILQQTRVEQGMDYYYRFIRRFPTIRDLAEAREEEVFKLWEGLGYYSRCRNLIHTARQISRDHNAVFPDDYSEILALRGVGPYTAAAIASFAFNQPKAVLDGNVFRVLARVFGINMPTDSTMGKKVFSEWADALIDLKNPGIYNQAIMDFGATVCKPLSPACSTCVFSKTCYARIHGKTASLPARKKKAKIGRRYFNYLVLSYRGRIAIRKRTGKDIWQDLYEFPLIESSGVMQQKKLISQARERQWISGEKITALGSPREFRQQLSHQTITGAFFFYKLGQKPAGSDWIWVSSEKLIDFTFPRLFRELILLIRTGSWV